MTSRTKDLLAEIRSVWGVNSDHERFVTSLLANLKPGDRYLDPPMIFELAPNFDKAKALQMMAWICMQEFGAFEERYVLYTDDTEVDLSFPEASEIIQTKHYISPETGEELSGDDILSRMAPYYIVSARDDEAASK